jgi:hypothetical protein
MPRVAPSNLVFSRSCLVNCWFREQPMQPDDNEERVRQVSLERLRREIQRGLDQLERGEGRDAEEVFEELLRGIPDPDDPDF